MHALERKILQKFARNYTQDHSTSSIVESIFTEEILEIKSLISKNEPELTKIAKRKKARLHRKLLYHLNILQEEGYLLVSKIRGRGEKYFLLNKDKKLSNKKDQLIGSLFSNIQNDDSKTSPLQGLEKYEEEQILKLFDEQGWSNKINALFVDTTFMNSEGELYSQINEAYSIYNDVLGLYGFDKFIQKITLESASSLLRRINIDLIDYNKQICIILDLTQTKNLVKINDFIELYTNQNPENIFLNLLINNKTLKTHSRFFKKIFSYFTKEKIRINLQNVSVIRAPALIGRAGVYTLEENDWDVYLSTLQGKIIGLCYSETSVVIDVFRFFKLYPNYSDFRNFIINTARSLLKASASQRKHSDVLFRSINKLNGNLQSKFFSFSKNYIRLWNYDLDNEEFKEFLALIKSTHEKLVEFSKSEETIFKSCGIPIRVHIQLSSAFKKFNNTFLSNRRYKKTTVKNKNDFFNEYFVSFLKNRELVSPIFEQTDRIRFFRANNFSNEDIFDELLFLFDKYRLPIIAYDFKSRQDEVTLDNFF